MPVRRPSREELQEAARAFHFELTEQELDSFLTLADGSLASYDRIDQLPEPKLPVRYPRQPGQRPTAEENPLGGWAWRCSVRGAEEGPLSGTRVAVKDTIAVAGIPLSNGTAIMEGFVSDVDATVVTRILDAGGEIAGKAMCENMCFSGASHTSHPWPVLNPYDPAYMASGSSSGSAALVGSGAVDMALGCDQGGSIREPAAWCGVLGLKPTWGLVPYTGILSLEPTLDHVGPMTATVEDMALLLDVIAGPDPLDPRTLVAPSERPSYREALEPAVRGQRIALIREGFEWPASEPEVEETVRAALGELTRLGAEVTEISFPWHQDASHLFTAVAFEGAWSHMIRDEGAGHGRLGYYDTHALDFFGRARRARAHDFPTNVKLVTVVGAYMAERYQGRYYAKAQNLRRTLRAAYDELFQEYDLLAMPTTPQRARPYDLGLLEPTVENIAASLDMINNTCPFDLTHHPALSIPCGLSEGRPVGLQLVAPHWQEARLLQAAYAFEQETGLSAPAWQRSAAGG